MKLALIGSQIQKSQSPAIYRELSKNQVEYQLIDIPPEAVVPPLDSIFQQHKLDGLSITAPYKKSFLEQVQILGDWPSINTVRKQKKSHYVIYEAINTDALAITSIWPELISHYGDRPILLFGDGAMSELLNKMFGDKISGVFSRKLGNLDSHSISTKLSGSIIINTCLKSFTFPQLVGSNFVIWDLNYGSDINEKYCLARGIPYIDGLNLLRRQAEYAYSFFLNKNL